MQTESAESEIESTADSTTSATARQAKAVRRYEAAAERGVSKRGRKRRQRQRADAIKLIVRWLQGMPLERTLEVTLVLAVAGSVLALGGVHPPVLAIICIVSTVGLGLALLIRDRHSPRIAGPGLVCWALAAWCLLQTVPLPMSWLETIAPANADIWQRALLPLGEAGPTSAPTSLDPGATAIEAARWFSYGAVVVASAQVASARGARWVLNLVFITAVVTALVTISHGFLGMSEVYGIYEPSFKAGRWHLGPLLNPNNLSGLLNIGAMCGLGLMLSDSHRSTSTLTLTGVALILGVNVISASRGGVALVFIGIVLLAITVELPNRRRSKEAPVGRARLMLGATLALGVALAFLGSRAALWTELLDDNVTKLRLIAEVEPAVSDFPLFGMGRGSFESVFAAYQPAHGNTVFTHAENFVAQWAVEWGVPVTLIALFALGYFFRPKRMGVRRSSLAAAAWLGGLIVLLQNLVDLGLEIPGVCIAIAATIGALWGDPDLYREPSNERFSRSRSIVSAGVALTIGLVLSVSGFAFGRHGVASDRLMVREQLLADKAPRSDAQLKSIRQSLRNAMLRHPAEPYFSLLGAELAWQERTGGAIPWLQRALERSAANGQAHLLLARVLWQRGARSQALLELRLAAETQSNLLGHTARDVANWTTSFDELERAMPKNDQAGKYWELIGRGMKDRAIGATCDQRAIALNPDLLEARQRLVVDIIKKRTAKTGCMNDDEQACSDEIEGHAQVATTQSPAISIGARMRANWLAALGKPAEAEQLLAKACEESDDLNVCLQARVTIAATIPGAEPFGEAAKMARRAACAEGDRCAAINTWIGDHHMARKEYGLAVTAFEKAVREHLTNARLERLVAAAIAARLVSRATRALERLIERTKDPAKKLELQGKRQKLMRGALR